MGKTAGKRERDYLFLLPIHLRSQSVLDKPNSNFTSIDAGDDDLTGTGGFFIYD